MNFKKWSLPLIILNLLLFSCFASVAGEFYSKDKTELSKNIDSLLKNKILIKGSGELIALIVPHAGYEYSADTASYAYKQVQGRKFDTVVVIGISHRISFEGIALIASGEYSSPLGSIKIDRELAEKLMRISNKIRPVPQIWDKEHSIDVQIPFIQRTMRGVKIVPLMFGEQSFENASVLADALVTSIGKKKVLIIASTDMSHFKTLEAEEVLDSAAAEAIGNGDVNLLISRLVSGQCEMCGYGPVITAMLTSDFLGANSYEILGRSNSSIKTNDPTNTVGYLSAAIYRRPIKLGDVEKLKLLEIARRTMTDYINYGTVPTIEVEEKELTMKSGLFVSLYKGGKLRGCIGYIRALRPLYLAVQDMTVAAATNDIRFTAVTSSELGEINVEISILSNFVSISGTKEVEIGRDGLFISNNGKSGLLLPQVATSNKLNAEQFLEAVCDKAGLSVDVIKDPNTRLFRFSADVFSEDDLGVRPQENLGYLFR